MANTITGGVERKFISPDEIHNRKEIQGYERKIQAVELILEQGDYSDYCKLNGLTIEQARSISREGLEGDLRHLKSLVTSCKSPYS